MAISVEAAHQRRRGAQYDSGELSDLMPEDKIS